MQTKGLLSSGHDTGWSLDLAPSGGHGAIFHHTSFGWFAKLLQWEFAKNFNITWGKETIICECVTGIACLQKLCLDFDDRTPIIKPCPFLFDTWHKTFWSRLRTKWVGLSQVLNFSKPWLFSPTKLE